MPGDGKLAGFRWSRGWSRPRSPSTPTALASAANREPRRAVLLYATDDHAAPSTIKRLIRAAGFDPLKAGGLADAGRIEMPGGDLHQYGLNGALIDLDEARMAVATEGIPA